MSDPQLFVQIDASLGWDAPTESEGEAGSRHQQQHEVNAMAADLEEAVKKILQAMIFHRKQTRGF